MNKKKICRNFELEKLEFYVNGIYFDTVNSSVFKYIRILREIVLKFPVDFDRKIFLY